MFSVPQSFIVTIFSFIAIVNSERQAGNNEWRVGTHGREGRINGKQAVVNAWNIIKQYWTSCELVAKKSPTFLKELQNWHRLHPILHSLSQAGSDLQVNSSLNTFWPFVKSIVMIPVYIWYASHNDSNMEFSIISRYIDTILLGKAWMAASLTVWVFLSNDR